MPMLDGDADAGLPGLERLTSGVTGRFGERYIGDDRSEVALVTSIFGGRSAVDDRSAMLRLDRPAVSCYWC